MPALLVTVVALILYVTLYPFHFDFGARHTPNLVHFLHSWPKRIDRGFLLDTVLNIALFLPLGVTAVVTYARHCRRTTAFALAVLHGFALSFAIELLQYYEPTRFSSIADCLFNTTGALLGAIIGLALQRRIEAITSAAGRRGTGPGVLLAVCWLGAQLYPLVPVLKIATLSQSIRFLLSTSLSWVEVLSGAAEWFVFGLALRAISGKMRWWWLVIGMCAVPVRLAIWDRTVTSSELLAVLLGLALWCGIPDAMRPGAGWILILSAVLLREFSPFHFAAHPHGFSWRPFAATMIAEHSPGVTVILRKGFEYGALVWLMHAGKMRYRTAAFTTAAGLFAMEWMQRYLPGREPEITDPLLALLMALILWFID